MVASIGGARPDACPNQSSESTQIRVFQALVGKWHLAWCIEGLSEALLPCL